MENYFDLNGSVLKLMRAMRRHPVHPNREFPPAVGRLLLALEANDGASPAELCEYMDVRPSSMSELLTRMEEAGLAVRTANENDKRATKVYQSDTGREAAQRISAGFKEENEKLASCFTPEELEQFCTLCGKLSAHLEAMPKKEFTGCGPHGPHHHGPGGHFRGFMPPHRGCR